MSRSPANPKRTKKQKKKSTTITSNNTSNFVKEHELTAPVLRRHGIQHVNRLIVFGLILCMLAIAFDLGVETQKFESSTGGAKRLFSMTMTLEEHFLQFSESWRHVQKLIPQILYEPTRPGVKLRSGEYIPGVNVTKHFPVILIPGIVSSKLEIWEGKECANGDFRCQYWGSTKMLEALLLRKKCWLQHIALNQTTGLDPEGIKMRVAEGLSAADFLIGDYWVWDKIIHNLADIGYDPDSMILAAYDWRLSNRALEWRDGFFSKLKLNIEFTVRRNGQKAVVVAHSMGSIVAHYFLQWVESPLGGNGGPDWAHKHIEAFVNVAGALLGVPKAQSALTSGEMRDTAELNTVLEYIKENLISNQDMVRLFRSFSSVASMIPKGGDRIWGNATWSPEDDKTTWKHKFTHGTIFSFSATNSILASTPTPMPFEGTESEDEEVLGLVEDDDNLVLSEECSEPLEGVEKCQDEDIDYEALSPYLDDSTVLTADSWLKFMRLLAPNYMKKVEKHDSWGLSRNITSDYSNPRYWNNPLESKLPYAPNMKVYSLYGTGKATERSYLYRYEKERCGSVPFHIAKNLTNNGIRLGAGDGTVPLISLGFMGLKGWKDPVYNPSGMKSITKEYLHKPEILAAGMFTDRFRGGIATADHVDIMGNHELVTDILLIASGHGDLVQDRFYSDLPKIVDRIRLDDD